MSTPYPSAATAGVNILGGNAWDAERPSWMDFFDPMGAYWQSTKGPESPNYSGAANTDFMLGVQNATKQMSQLSEEAKYDLALRIYDLMQYEDIGFARRYVDGVMSVYKRDNAQRSFAATHATIWNLALARAAGWTGSPGACVFAICADARAK